MGSAAPRTRAGSRRARSRRRWATVGAAVLLVAALVGGVIALQQAGRAAVGSGLDPQPVATSAPAGSSSPIPTPTPTPTSTPSPTTEAVPTPTPTSGEALPPDPVAVAPRAAFIGDSYTQGGGAEPDSERWSTVAAAALGWSEENFGRGGTGFVTANSYLGCGLEYCSTYLETVPEVVAFAPDIVVVAGGQNDFDAYVENPDAVRAAVSETYHNLRAGLPEATIVAVGPSTPWAVDDTAIGLDSAVRAAATAVGAAYVSMLEPNVIDPAFLLPDGHVNNEGHRAIAQRVVDALADRSAQDRNRDRAGCCVRGTTD